MIDEQILPKQTIGHLPKFTARFMSENCFKGDDRGNYSCRFCSKPCAPNVVKGRISGYTNHVRHLQTCKKINSTVSFLIFLEARYAGRYLEQEKDLN